MPPPQLTGNNPTTHLNFGKAAAVFFAQFVVGGCMLVLKAAAFASRKTIRDNTYNPFPIIKPPTPYSRGIFVTRGRLLVCVLSLGAGSANELGKLLELQTHPRHLNSRSKRKSSPMPLKGIRHWIPYEDMGIVALCMKKTLHHSLYLTPQTFKYVAGPGGPPSTRIWLLIGISNSTWMCRIILA